MVKNIVIALLMTKVLLDNVMMPCDTAESFGVFVAAATCVVLFDYLSSKKSIRRKKR